jgi:S1-C subfamily serine protease
VVAALVAFVAVAATVVTQSTARTTRSPSAAGPLAPPSSAPPTTAPTPATPGAPSPSPTDPGRGTGGSPSGEPLGSWEEVASVVNPGVVNIETETTGGVGAGTGMVLTESGEILTNNHVVEDAGRIYVTVATTGETYRATIVGADAAQDIAVLQVSDASGMRTIPLGDSDAVDIGDGIAAIGNAGGTGGEPTVTTGTVVGLNRSIPAADQFGGDLRTLRGMIQVNARVIPGNSGGPLASDDGKVVGINTAASAGVPQGRSRYRTAEDEGYAIPINRALQIVDEIRSGGGDPDGGTEDEAPATGQRGVLGVQVQQASSSGAAVVAVVGGSGAQDAGIRAGDVIVEVDGEPVDSPSDLTAALSGMSPGDTVSVTWETSTGAARSADITLT